MFVKPLSPSYIVTNIMEPVERLDAAVTKIVMSPDDYPDLMKFGRDVLDIVTDRTMLKTGLVASMFNVNLYVSRGVSEGKFKVEVDHVGKGHDVCWCTHCEQAIAGAFCNDINCIAAEIHES